MPIINIEYDNKKVKKVEILVLSKAMQKIVKETTKIDDVFVYANSALIKVGIAPIEIFVRMSAHKIKDEDTLIHELKTSLALWKKKNAFSPLINLTLIPMKWKIEIGI